MAQNLVGTKKIFHDIIPLMNVNLTPNLFIEIVDEGLSGINVINIVAPRCQNCGFRWEIRMDNRNSTCGKEGATANTTIQRTSVGVKRALKVLSVSSLNTL